MSEYIHFTDIDDNRYGIKREDIQSLTKNRKGNRAHISFLTGGKIIRLEVSASSYLHLYHQIHGSLPKKALYFMPIRGNPQKLTFPMEFQIYHGDFQSSAPQYYIKTLEVNNHNAYNITKEEYYRVKNLLIGEE